MKNKIMLMMCVGLLGISVLGLTYDNQVPVMPHIALQERLNEKATFDHNQAIYNNKTNIQMRAVELAHQDGDAELQERRKVEEARDTGKGQILFRF